MKFLSSPPLAIAEEWPAFREELTTTNLTRMWWLLITSTSLSIVLALFNVIDVQKTQVAPWQIFDIGGSLVFLLLINLARKGTFPRNASWALCPAYFLFWIILMDGYYFSTLPYYGETATYALGVVTPSILIFLPPRLFLSLLIPNHVVFIAITLLYPAASAGRSAEEVTASLTNGTLGVLVAILGSWFLYAAKKSNFRNERLISQRTREARLAESHLRSILENIPFQAWLKDSQGRFLAANGKFAEANNLSLKEIVGKSIPEIYPPDRASQYLEEDKQIMANRQKADFEQVITESNGPHWYEVFKSPVIDEDGMVIGTAGLARDITSRKEIEERLVAADKAKSDFLAAMSHEIRTPMNSVLGYAHILRDQPLQPAEKEHVESIIASGQLLLSVINDILDFSKFEAGKISLQNNRIDLPTLISRVERMFEPLAIKKALSLRVVLSPDAPHTIRGDFHRIEQILVNLVSNALKFTEKGFVELQVTSQTDPHSPKRATLHFRVSDSGIGITPAQMERLFKPFSQVDSAISRRFSGTGLGLVIAKRLCESMEGTIKVQSTAGLGATFVASINVEVQTGRAEPPGQVAPIQDTVCRDSARSRRILVVEDNPSNLRLLSTILQRWGITPAIARCGREALAACEAEPFDCILMDIQMPEMDGFEATRKIREFQQASNQPKSRIIALTALAMAEDRERCFEAGMDDYVAKPLNPDALRRALGLSVRASEPQAG